MILHQSNHGESTSNWWKSASLAVETKHFQIGSVADNEDDDDDEEEEDENEEGQSEEEEEEAQDGKEPPEDQGKKRCHSSDYFVTLFRNLVFFKCFTLTTVSFILIFISVFWQWCFQMVHSQKSSDWGKVIHDLFYWTAALILCSHYIYVLTAYVWQVDATNVLSAMGAIPSGFRPSTLNKLLVEGYYLLSSAFVHTCSKCMCI